MSGFSFPAMACLRRGTRPTKLQGWESAAKNVLSILFWIVLSWLVTLPAWGVDPLPVTTENEHWLRRKPEIERVVITGNAHIAEGDIRHHLELKSPSLRARIGLGRRPRVVGGAWERDRKAVLALYATRGYLNAETTVAVTRDEKTDRAIVSVDVREGGRTVWGGITTEGDDLFISGRTYRWMKELKRGDPADPRKLQRVLALCQGTYADYGHPYARFAAQWDIDSTAAVAEDTANVHIVVDPGPEARFGQVQVTGNTFTREPVIRRELAFRPGDPYSRKKIFESQNNIYRTGLFTFTRLELSADSTAKEAPRRDPDFTVRVVERKPAYLDLATGAGQDRQQDLTWDYSLEWGNRNWLGTGRHWALQAKSGLIVVTDWRVLYNRFVARYTEPWILGLRLPTTVQFAYEPGVRSAVQPYRIERLEGELGFQTRVGETKRAWLTFVYENVRIFGIDRPIEEILREKGITIRRKVVFAVEKDSRPNVFVPTAGSLTRLDAEYAGGFLGGDVDFYKVVGSWARYQTTGSSVLASRFQFGLVKAHSGAAQVPTIDRFYTGGANSIRGYPENRVGPMIDGTPEGAGVLALANVELRTPAIWRFWFTVFGDAGNAWSRFRDFSGKEILVSTGIGLQYVSPVGPLRLDYAKRISHPGHPASDRLHLAILFAF